MDHGGGDLLRRRSSTSTRWTATAGSWVLLLLAIQSRGPALLSACLLIVGVFELGRTIRDSSLGLTSAVICATTYFVLVSRYSTTDIQLALWVTWGNCFSLARCCAESGGVDLSAGGDCREWDCGDCRPQKARWRGVQSVPYRRSSFGLVGPR